MIKQPSDYVRDSHCSYCGSKFPEQKTWPRKCFSCYNESYKNPLPVVAGLLPVIGPDRPETGLLIGKRGIAPGIGKWALIGGFMEYNETYQEALVREVKEEIGLITAPNDWKLFDVKSSSEHLLLFGIYNGKIINLFDIQDQFIPNDEISALSMFNPEQPLVFPTHQEVAIDFLSKKSK